MYEPQDLHPEPSSSEKRRRGRPPESKNKTRPSIYSNTDDGDRSQRMRRRPSFKGESSLTLDRDDSTKRTYRRTRERLIDPEHKEDRNERSKPERYKNKQSRSVSKPYNPNKKPRYKPQRKESQSNERAYIPVGEPEERTGLLDITPKNFGFLLDNNGQESEERIYIPADLIAQHHLRPMVQITGMAQRFERGHQLISITSVNGEAPEEAAIHPHFDELKAVNPTHRIAFETTPSRYTTRTLDLVAPIARGQRGLIVAPPRTGKTTLLMHMAEAIQENYSDDIHLMILLIDERPEEVTEFKRCLPGVDIYSSSNDSKVRDHCRIAEICIERAKRLVESGKHVLLLLDSITRLARAYNNDQRGTGRTMSGGIDARALEIPRRLFAAARATRKAGSLSIIATALIETNSRMDELIFQEFKGTGNMELVLNRRIAEMYVYPAVDILKSGTRREELILSEHSLEKVRLIRRALAGHKPVEAMERLLFFLKKYRSNAQMLMDLKTR